MSAPQRVRLFLAGTEFFRTGGIQQVNRLLLRAWLDFSARSCAEVEAFSLADAPEAPAVDWLQQAPWRWHGMGRSRRALVQRLAARVAARQPHLVLLTHVHLVPLLPLVRLISPRTRVAVLGHGVEVWQRLPWATRLALRWADAVVAPSRYTAMQLQAFNGVRRRRVSVIAHGLDPAWELSTAFPARASTAGPALLTVARLSAADVYKGVDRVVEALPAVLAHFPQARLVVAGDGDDRARLERIAEQRGVAPRIEFRGGTSAADLRSLYAACDLFVLPSRKEGFGLVFAEAMACGKPVVAARAGGATDVVEHGVTGLLVSGEGDELAQAIISVLRDPHLRARMGAAGRARVLQRFLYRHFAERWTAWLAQLLPEAVYLSRHAAVYAAPAPTPATEPEEAHATA
jgi:glycosyltransferase involved in cell wall biosynthesis